MRLYFRLLTLLLGIFYLDTVCQTDAEDARAYYARGIQEYVAAPNAVLVAAPAARPAAPMRPRRAASSRQSTRHQRRLAARAESGLAGPPARARRWLWCAVLQV